MTLKTLTERFHKSACALETPEDQEQIGRSLLSHVEKLRALRAEIDKGIASLDMGLGKESSMADFLRCKNRSEGL